MIAPHRQTGLSLIELMIALAISSFLILGITQVYIDNQRHYLFQQSQSSNLDSGRFAALILDQYLSKTGYRRNPANLEEYAFPDRAAGGGCLAFKAGASITGLDPDEGLGFCIRYQPQASGELDCQGTASSAVYDKAFPDSVATSDLIVEAFKYTPDSGTDLQNGRLLCKNLNATNPQFTEQLTGIADMRMEFGLGANAADKSVATYVSAKDWSTDTSNPIRSVRYSMLLSSRPNQRDTADRPAMLENWLALAPAATKTRLQNGDQRRVYQVVGSARTVRNLMP